MDENTNGRLEFLTPSQTDTLQQFKISLSSCDIYDPSKYDDHHLLRFLRARQFQIPKAQEMFLKYIQWKNEFGTNTILQEFEFPEYLKVRQFYPRIYHKTDRIGRPIYIERLGQVDITKLWQVTTHERMLKNHVYEVFYINEYEKLVHYRLKACSIKAGRYHEQSTTILDLDGVALSSFSSVYSLISQVSSIAQDYYPEMLGKMFIINAPMLFTAVWKVVKQLLDEATVNKIQIIGYNYKSTLLKTINEDSLPDFLGGSCKCEGGCANADVGPWNDGSVDGYPMPEMEKFVDLYLKNQDESNNNSKQ